MTVKLPPAGGGKTATRAPRPSSMAGTKYSQDELPSPKSTRKGLPATDQGLSTPSVPGLDLANVSTSKKDDVVLPPSGDERSKTASKGKSALAAALQGVNSNNPQAPQPPGGSARQRGKYGGRYVKWMKKSVIGLRRANERVTNPRSPLFRRRQLRRAARENQELGESKPNEEVGMERSEVTYGSLSAVTDRLHNTLSLHSLDQETRLMLDTKRREVGKLRSIYDSLIDRGRSLEKKLALAQKERKRESKNLNAIKKLRIEADSSPMILELHKRTKETKIMADREESYTYVMRLLHNRAETPLKAINKRLKLLSKENKTADLELKSSGQRLRRLEERRDRTLKVRDNLESQLKEATQIYLQKGHKLRNVEKNRKKQQKKAIIREEQRQNLHFMLHGDRGEAEEHALKNTLMMRTFKGKAVNARANLMKKHNDELTAAFTKMMKAARDEDIQSITEKFIHRGERSAEMEKEELSLMDRLDKARLRNKELAQELERIHLEFDDPNEGRERKKEFERNEQRLHNLGFVVQKEESRAERINVHLAQTQECLKTLIKLLESSRKTKEQQIISNTFASTAAESSTKSPEEYETIDTSHMHLPSFEHISTLLARVIALVKVISSGLNLSEGYEGGGAGAIYKAHNAGLLGKQAPGNCRVTTSLTPEEEDKIIAAAQKSNMNKGSLLARMHDMVEKRAEKARDKVEAVKLAAEKELQLNKAKNGTDLYELDTDDEEDEASKSNDHKALVDKRHSEMMNIIAEEVADRTKIKHFSAQLMSKCIRHGHSGRKKEGKSKGRSKHITDKDSSISGEDSSFITQRNPDLLTRKADKRKKRHSKVTKKR